MCALHLSPPTYWLFCWLLLLAQQELPTGFVLVPCMVSWHLWISFFKSVSGQGARAAAMDARTQSRAPSYNWLWKKGSPHNFSHSSFHRDSQWRYISQIYTVLKLPHCFMVSACSVSCVISKRQYFWYSQRDTVCQEKNYVVQYLMDKLWNWNIEINQFVLWNRFREGTKQYSPVLIWNH